MNIERQALIFHGRASPDLLRQTSESLAGRIAYHELGALGLAETGARHADRLWRRGGFPRSYLARSEAASRRWREELIRTYLERDVPALGIRLPAAALRRLWTMLAARDVRAVAFGRLLEDLTPCADDLGPLLPPRGPWCRLRHPTIELSSLSHQCRPSSVSFVPRVPRRSSLVLF